MKFVKENLTLVICGAVVLLAAVAFWYMTGPAQGSVQAQMAERHGITKTIEQKARMALDFPGGVKRTGLPTPDMTLLREQIIKRIEDAKKNIDNRSRDENKRGRVNAAGAPLLPKLNGSEAITGYLPTMSVSAPPMAFKAKYTEQFKTWRQALTGNPATFADPLLAIPPVAAELTNAWTTRQATLNAGLPPGAMNPQGGADVRARNNFLHGEVSNRAASLRMYIEPAGFQIRPWGLDEQPPNEQQIFEAFVDTWIQCDIVKAINEVNGATGHDIKNSAIKRLTRITIGNNARTRTVGMLNAGLGMAPPGTVGTLTDPGLLFFTSTNANQMGAQVPGMTPVLLNPDPSGQPVAVEVTPNKIDYQFSMTGHTSGAEYDVVLFSVVMDIQPQKANLFVDNLYRKNMGYTEIQRQVKTVDPIERVSFGYLYGDSDAVEVEFLFEAIFFRTWTTPLMPKEIKTMLNIPLVKPAGT